MLRDIVLIEDFRKNVHKSVCTHLDDLCIVDLHEAACRTNDYAVTHKLLASQVSHVLDGKDTQGSRGSDRRNDNACSDNRQTVHAKTGTESLLSDGSKAYCDFHKKSGHNTSECKTLQCLNCCSGGRCWNWVIVCRQFLLVHFVTGQFLAARQVLLVVYSGFFLYSSTSH